VQVLDASILKVSSFLNHMVDVELMEACGEEMAERLEDTQPTKVTHPPPLAPPFAPLL
jgi:hypothetical protein